MSVDVPLLALQPADSEKGEMGKEEEGRSGREGG